MDWHRIAPTTFLFKETALEPDAVSNQIRAYYFGTKDVGNDTYQELEHLYSDRYFNHGIRTSALMHVRTNEAIPVYLYLFSYKGAESHTKFAGISDIIGKLFYINSFSSSFLHAVFILLVRLCCSSNSSVIINDQSICNSECILRHDNNG